MENKPVVNQNYEIFEECQIGSKAFVLGYNPLAAEKYVSWKCDRRKENEWSGGSYYYDGYYSNDLQDVREKMFERAMIEADVMNSSFLDSLAEKYIDRDEPDMGLRGLFK